MSAWVEFEKGPMAQWLTESGGAGVQASPPSRGDLQEEKMKTTSVPKGNRVNPRMEAPSGDPVRARPATLHPAATLPAGLEFAWMQRATTSR
jgi:hypothetical protein